jgi:hypothetical protein
MGLNVAFCHFIERTTRKLKTIFLFALFAPFLASLRLTLEGYA